MKAINDLARHVGPLRLELQQAMQSVLDSGWFVLGPRVSAFETAFARYCGVDHCVSTGNGTDALELALRALGIGEGHHVATVANAGMYATNAILAAGALPVFVDVCEATLLIDLDALQKAIADRSIDAVIVTHLYGAMVDVERVQSFCGNGHVKVIEDCAQAHGARMNGKMAGSVADAGCFSFYPTKNLGALGDGGAVVSMRSDVAGRLAALRQYGWESKYVSKLRGGRNSRLDELQAAVLAVKLPHLEDWNRRRRAIAQRYCARIENRKLTCPDRQQVGQESYVGHLFVIRTSERAALRVHLQSRGIPSDIHYPVPDHWQPALRDAYGHVRLRMSEQASAEVLTLPCFPEMTSEEIDEVIDAVNAW